MRRRRDGRERNRSAPATRSQNISPSQTPARIMKSWVINTNYLLIDQQRAPLPPMGVLGVFDPGQAYCRNALFTNKLKGLSREIVLKNIVKCKVDWLDACIAPRVVGAVLVVFLWRWRKICTILKPMGSKGRYGT